MGCPSQRVSTRCFGAKLMLDPPLVSEIMSAMYREVDIPVTAKCRIGVDELDSYEYLYDFIDTVATGVMPDAAHVEGGHRPRPAEGGGGEKDESRDRGENEEGDRDDDAKVEQWLTNEAEANVMKEQEWVERRERKARRQAEGQRVVDHFVVHARKALLLGRFSTLDNRRIPELKYDTVYKLKREERFSDLRFTINGGVETYEQIAHHLANGVDGVMLGRIATKDPWLLTQVDARFFGKANPCLSRREVLEKYCDYVDKHTQERKLVKRGLLVPIVPLFHGKKDGRRFRQELNRALDEDKRSRANKGERENWETSAWDVVEEALKGISDDTLNERPPTCDLFDS